MDVAWLAFSVAVVSLGWNVASTVRTWQRAKPKVNATMSAHFTQRDGPDRLYGSLVVTAANVGGSSIGVQYLELPFGGGLMKFEKLPLLDVLGCEVTGAPLPHTLGALDVATWVIDISPLARQLKHAPSDLQLDVVLSTGERATANLSLAAIPPEVFDRVADSFRLRNRDRSGIDS